MSKNTLNWYDRNNPQREAVAKYRSPEQEQKENFVSDFMWFLKFDTKEELTMPEQDLIGGLMKEFLGITQEQVKQGEQEMLKNWIEASQTK